MSEQYFMVESRFAENSVALQSATSNFINAKAREWKVQTLNTFRFGW